MLPPPLCPRNIVSPYSRQPTLTRTEKTCSRGAFVPRCQVRALDGSDFTRSGSSLPDSLVSRLRTGGLRSFLLRDAPVRVFSYLFFSRSLKKCRSGPSGTLLILTCCAAFQGYMTWHWISWYVPYDLPVLCRFSGINDVGIGFRGTYLTILPCCAAFQGYMT